MEIFIYRVLRDEEMQKKIGQIVDESIIKIKQYVDQYFSLCKKRVA